MKSLVPAMGLLLLAACIDSEEEIALNPDGSGKVAYTLVFKPFEPFQKDQDADKALRKAVQDELDKSQGVDVWKDVAFEKLEDGRFKIKGTAYFSDLSRLRLHKGGSKGTLSQLLFVKTANGGVSVEVKIDRNDANLPKPKNDEELKAKVKEAREQWEQMKPMAAAVLSKMKDKVILHLPAKAADSTNFKADGDRSASITFDGSRLLELMDKMMTDEAFLAEQLKGGGEEAMAEKIFGQKGPIKVVTVGDAKPQFDYAAEVKQAKDGYDAMIEKLKLTAPPAAGGDVKSIKVAGIQYVYADESFGGFRPFNSSPGIGLSLVADLPGAVLKIKGGKVEKAVTDDGQDLVAEDTWGRDINFPNLSDDKSRALFEVRLKLPGDKARALAEVSGTLEYIVAGKTKEVDLGFTEFKAGAKGKELGASIEKLGPSSWKEGSQELTLQLALDREAVASIHLYDGKGAEIKTQDGGYSGSEGQVSFTFVADGAFPDKGKIVVKRYDDLKTFKSGFKLTQVDLLGHPKK